MPLKIVKKEGTGTSVLNDGQTCNTSKLVAALHMPHW